MVPDALWKEAVSASMNLGAISFWTKILDDAVC